MGKLKVFYDKYKEYIRVDALMYIVMILLMVAAVIVISVLRD